MPSSKFQTKTTVSAGINTCGTDPSLWTRGPKPKHQWPLESTNIEVDTSRRKIGRKVKNKYPLDSKADEHTKGDKMPVETMSAPAHNVRLGSGRYYAPSPSPAYHGPNFEKGALQAEIRQEFGMVSIWNPDTKIQDVSHRPEFKARAHSIHSPVFHHRLQEPYEKCPEYWTDQMNAEGKEYHRLSDSASNRNAVKAAKNAASEGSDFQTLTHGKGIVDGISRARKGRLTAKLAAHARVGFMQKYPQSFEKNKIQGHKNQVSEREANAKTMREDEKSLQRELNIWEISSLEKGVEEWE